MNSQWPLRVPSTDTFFSTAQARVRLVLVLVLSAFAVLPSPSTVQAAGLSSVCAQFASASIVLPGAGIGNGIVGHANPGEVFTITFTLTTATSATIRLFGGFPGNVTFAGPASVPGRLSYTVPGGGLPAGAVGVGFILVTADGSVTVKASCQGIGSVTWCDLTGDGRVREANCAERVVAYCNVSSNPPTLDVWGVGPDSVGFRLTTFKFSDLAQAGAGGLTRKLDKLGTVSAMVDAKNNFWIAWNGQVSVPGGTFYADGQPDHGFAKGFSCSFSR